MPAVSGVPARLFCRLAVVVTLLVLPAVQGTSWADNHRSGDFEEHVDVGGYQLFLRCRGTGSPTVVLDAALGADSRTWDVVQPAVAGFTRVCSYDRAGRGRSDPAPLPRTSQAIVDDLRALLGSAGVPGPYVLVGHSFGGLNVQLFARQDQLQERQVVGTVLVDATPEKLIDRFAEVLTPEQLDLVLPPPDGNPEGVDLRASADQVGWSPAFPDIPLVVLTHTVPNPPAPGFPNDALEGIWQQLQRDQAGLSSQGELVAPPGARHFIHVDRPEVVIDSIRSVVAQVRRSVLAVDHFVPHISTVAANAGQHVELYLRERVLAATAAAGPERRAVLFVPGSATSAVPTFDLPFQDYSWMASLARAGLDTFALDPTGYGRSPRPTMDDPCNVNPAQQSLLVPNPLAAPCPVRYAFRLGTTQSDLDEIGAAVDYIRAHRGVDRVSLVGWSLGGHRAGLYAARNPAKVDRLVLLAPNYTRGNPSLPPPSNPQPGFPTALRDRSTQVNWPGVSCTGQVDPAVRDPLWASVLDNDRVGATWRPPEGVMRFPTSTQLQWNAAAAAAVAAPTLVVRGQLDTTIAPLTVTELHEDLGTSEKALVTVPCASHFMMWESGRHVLHDLSTRWLLDG